MSGHATKAFNVNQQFSTLWLVGGYDCNPYFDPIKSTAITNVDLRVKGGAEIYKNLCVGGNIKAKWFIGNVCSKLIAVDKIKDKSGKGILVSSNVIIDPPYSLDVQTLKTEFITNQSRDSDILIGPEGNILLCSQNNGKVYVCTDLCVSGNVDFSRMKHTIGSNVGTIFVDGNLLPGANVSYELGNMTHKWKRIVTDDLIVCGNTNIQGGNGGGGWVGKATSNLDMTCHVISNVMALHVGNLYGKSPINVHDNFHMLDTVAGGKITWEGGIEIGNANTIASYSSSIALGKQATAGNSDCIAIGTLAFNSERSSISIGKEAYCSAPYSVAIGRSAVSKQMYAIAIGSSYYYYNKARAYGRYSIAMGTNAYSYGDGSVSIGYRSYCASYDSVAIGRRAQAYYGYYSIAIGVRAGAGYSYAVAVGPFAEASGYNAIALGSSAATGSNENTIVIGYSATSAAKNGIAIGSSGFMYYTANDAISIGSYQLVYAPQSIVIGDSSTNKITATKSISIGTATYSTSVDTIAIGTYASTYGAASIAIGRESSAPSSFGIVIGDKARAESSNVIAIGTNSHVLPNSLRSVALGYGARVQGDSFGPQYASPDCIAIGTNSSITYGSESSIVIGLNAQVAYSEGFSANVIAIGTNVRSEAANDCIVLGHGASILVGTASLSIGLNSYSGTAHSIAIGEYSLNMNIGSNPNNAINQIAIGRTSYTAHDGCIAIGYQARAHNNYSPYLALYAIAIGGKATARENFSLAMGYYTLALGESSIAIGQNAYGVSNCDIAIGKNAYAADYYSIAIGKNSSSNYSYSVAIGCNAYIGTEGPYCVAIGYNSKAAYYSAIAIGYNSYAEDYSVAIGPYSYGGNGSIAIGEYAYSGGFGAFGCVAIGPNAYSGTEGPYCVAIGSNSKAADDSSIAIGYNSYAKSYSLAIGPYSNAGNDSLAIGKNASANYAGSIALGNSIAATQPGGFFVSHRAMVYSASTAGWIGNELVDTVSSMRFKQNIQPLEPVNDKFAHLRPVRYNPKEGFGNINENFIGFIAEEVAELFPEVVVFEEDKKTPKSIMYDKMVALAIKEIQTLNRTIDLLQNQIEKIIGNLQNNIETLFAKINQ